MSAREQSSLSQFPATRKPFKQLLFGEMYMDKGQKLQNCTAGFGADGRLFCTPVHGAAKAPASALCACGLPGGLQCSWGRTLSEGVSAALVPGVNVHTTEDCLVLPKLYRSRNHPTGRKASILSEPWRHCADVEPETPRTARVFISLPHWARGEITHLSFLTS